MRIVIILIILAVIAALCIYIYKESTGFRVVSYELLSGKVKRDVKIVFMSDLHNVEHGRCNEELIKAIDNIAPDMVILGGDMVTGCMAASYDFNATLQFIKNLSGKYKIFYGIGNHEAKFRELTDKFEGIYDKFTGYLAGIDVPLLADSKDSLDDLGIDIYCLDLDHKYYRKVITRRLPEQYINEKLGRPDEEKYSILIAHNPEHFIQYAKWGADLVLSGHVHGGVIDIPYLGGLVSPALKLFPKYDSGKFTEGTSTMLLTRGIGSHTVPVRINNKAEIVTISIKGE